jgi:hypothetical protein
MTISNTPSGNKFATTVFKVTVPGLFFLQVSPARTSQGGNLMNHRT